MNILIIATILCLFSRQVYAQYKPGECSLTTEFGMEVAECFLQKFQKYIDMIPQTQNTAVNDQFPSADLSLNSHEAFLFGEKDYTKVTQSYVLKSIISRLKTEQKAKITEESLKAQEKKVKLAVVEQIEKNVDFTKIQDDLTLKILGIFGALREQSVRIMSQNTSSGDISDDIEDLLCGWIGSAIDKDLCRMFKCLKTYEEADFEDGLKWARCAYTCSDLTAIGQCMHTAFSNCRVSVLNELLTINLEWLADIALRVVVDYLELDMCVFDIKGNPLTLEEGGPPASISISSYLPPGVHCMNKLDFTNTPAGIVQILYEFVTGNLGNCKVAIELSLSNYFKDAISMKIPYLGSYVQNPICPSGSIIPQSVLVVTEHLNTTTGTFQLNDTNWNETFIVKVQSSVQNKNVLPQYNVIFKNESLTVRLKAGLLTRNTSKIDLTSNREDIGRVRTCWTVSDPHIKTFDGHYYNNMYEGYFYLYKHTSLPYEVQVVYQRCGPNHNVTCTCAASVRSGDDVFTVDWCRRKGQEDNSRVKRVNLYSVSKEINPRIRIFRQDDGLIYKVLLPHGQMVTIGSTDGWLNVWVRPTNFDREATLGLCGYFDGNSTQDLVLPNGSVYVGDDDKEGDEPKAFNEAWRVPEDEIILKGVSVNESAIQVPASEYCVCSHVVFLGVQCKCGPDKLVQICDHETEGELTSRINLITRYSLRQFLKDHPGEIDEDLPDIDASWDPPARDWANVPPAKNCKKWIEKDKVQVQCDPFFSWSGISKKWKNLLSDYSFINVCQQDAKISEDDTHLSLSSRMAARQFCYDYLDFNFDVGLNKYEKVYAVDCPNDCNPQLSKNNTCDKGNCSCDPAYDGIDCGIAVSDKPLVLMPNYSPCDTRFTDCSFATVYGKNFLREDVACWIKSSETGSQVVKDALFLSSYQLACELPTSGNRFTVGISQKNSRVARAVRASSDSFEFKTFDSQCHVCDTTTGDCVERKAMDYCYVDGQCYASDDTSVHDECYQCVPAESQKELQYKDTEHCRSREQERLSADKEWNTRVIIACVLSALIIAATIILFAVSRNSKNTKDDFELKSGGVGTSTVYHADEPNVQTRQAIDNVYDVADAAPMTMGQMDETSSGLGLEHFQHVPSPAGAEISEINARELAEFWSVKQYAQERSRSESVTSKSSRSSIASTGIGGSSLMASSRVRNDSMASYGMGAGGPAHLGRFTRRAYTNSSAGFTDDEDPIDRTGMGGGGMGGTGFVSRL